MHIYHHSISRSSDELVLIRRRMKKYDCEKVTALVYESHSRTAAENGLKIEFLPLMGEAYFP